MRLFVFLGRLVGTKTIRSFWVFKGIFEFLKIIISNLIKKNLVPKLKQILKQPLPKTVKAGLHPTAEQIELFAYQ